MKLRKHGMNRNEMLAKGMAILAPKAIGNPSLHEGLLLVRVSSPSGLSKPELAELKQCRWTSGREDNLRWWEFRIEER